MIPWRTPARHRKSLPLQRRIIIPVLTILAALALAAGIVTGLSPASAAPAAAVTMMADRAAAFPAAVLAPVPDRTLITRAVTRARARAAAHAAAVLAARTYTVRSGDSMSSVAARRCGPARDWTGIYAASRAHRWTARNANVLTAGQRLYLACAYLPSMLRYAPAPPPVVHAVTAAVTTARTSTVRHRGSGRAWGVTRGYPNYCGDGDGDGWDVACRPAIVAVAASPVRRAYHRSYTAASSATYHAASGSYQACVISRESGGNSQVMNSSGHYGLYQFDYGTWTSGGGSGSTFGHASVAEQNRVFAAVYAARGTQPWSPSDHC